jgi:hypothetical protein
LPLWQRALSKKKLLSSKSRLWPNRCRASSKAYPGRALAPVRTSLPFCIALAPCVVGVWP